MKKILIALSLLGLISCGSIKKMVELSEKQAVERRMLETYIYPQELPEMKERVLKALDNKRDPKKAPLIVLNKSMGEIDRNNRVGETLAAKGFRYKDKYFVDEGIEIGFQGITGSLFKGTHHILVDTKTRVVIMSGPLSYELIQVKDGGTQVHVYRLRGLVRGPIQVELDFWQVLSGRLPFLLKEGAISYELSRADYGQRDMYAELELFYLNKTI